jgi:hypothetical protein
MRPQPDRDPIVDNPCALPPDGECRIADFGCCDDGQVFEAGSAQHWPPSRPPHDHRVLLAAAIEECARLRTTQDRLMAQLWRDGAVSDMAYGAYVGHGDQVDADIVVLRICYGHAACG